MEEPRIELKRWQADWIWYGKEEAPFHFHLFLRRNFELEGEVSPAFLYITATDKYLVYVNSEYIGRGPARGWRRDAQPINIGVGVTEVYDSRLDPPDGMMPDFDDGI